MKKHKTDSFFKSEAWKICKANYLQLKGGLCEECLKLGIQTPATEVRHRKPITEYNMNDASVTLDYNNLMCLCQLHNKARYRKTIRRYTIDASGSVTPREDINDIEI